MTVHHIYDLKRLPEHPFGDLECTACGARWTPLPAARSKVATEGSVEAEIKKHWSDCSKRWTKPGGVS